MSTVFEIPTLQTDRLTLRAFRASDLDAYADLNADSVFRRWLGGRTLSRHESWAQMETALGQWALRGYGLFAVILRGTLIGRIGILHPAEWPEAELAWGIAPAFWGQGLATEAARTVKDWGFSTFGFPRLASFILPENAPSRRVAERLGAVRDGMTEIRGFQAEYWVHPAPGTGVVA
ncbi:MAG: GNAT family N-acetyltransferase [Acetobacteraceae bacterium]